MGGRTAPRAVLAALALAGGCELSEVVTPAGEDLLVVEAVLREGEPTQEVLLHRALSDRAGGGEPGARVVIRGPSGDSVRLTERALSQCANFYTPPEDEPVSAQASCYVAFGLPVEAGEEYELRVETRAGEVVRGRTRVPGGFGLRRPPRAAGPDLCALPPDTNVTLAWSPSAGAWSYLITAEISGLRSALRERGILVDAPDRLELTGVAVSEGDTTLVLPAQLGVFERTEVDQELLRVLQAGFPPGVRVRVTVAAADRNLINAVRGGGFNPSGNVRVSSVVGDAVGVFGSLVARTALFSVESGDATALPPC